MVFSSTIFLFTFLPITILLYLLVPRVLKNPVLLVCSLVFYAWGEPIYIFLMIFSILFNYISGLDIARNLNDKRAAKVSLIFNIIVNLAILGFFKYFGFVVSSLNAVLPFDIPYRELALPIGISFYTFQTLSYIIDVYRGTVKVQRNLLNFGVYVTMFPQLIAGPIVKYKDIETQLKNREETLSLFGNGTIRFIKGLAKKVLFANVIGLTYTRIMALSPEETSIVTAWLGVAAFTFQIYFDFSGYSDMAIGLGEMFGFHFQKNFDYPYISKSITEFWRRWHISLSTWFREYLYIPLGGNRVTVLKHIRNIMVVWMLTGLWHGASWNFVAWGLYYGILLVVEKYLLGGILEKMPGFLCHIYTMIMVMIGWVFFSSETLGGAFQYLGLMVGMGGAGFVDNRAIYYLLSDGILWILLILASTPVIHRCYQHLVRKGTRADVVFNTLVYGLIFIISVAFLVTETYNPFLYFRF